MTHNTNQTPDATSKKQDATHKTPEDLITVDLTAEQSELICYAIRCAPVHDTTISLDILSLLGEEA